MGPTVLSTKSPVTTGYVEASGARIYYELTGTGYPLVLLHAGGLDCRMWDEQFRMYAETYTVIRYDIPACGRSSVPNESFSDAGILSILLEHLGVRQACLLGASLGGRIALDFAVEFPSRVKALILAAPGLGGYEWSSEYMEQIGRIFSVAEQNGPLQAVEEWLKHPHMLPAMENIALRERIRQMNLDNANLWTQPLPEKPLDPPAVKRLKSLNIPTQIIVGDRDVPDIHAIADLIAANVAGAIKVIINGAGHVISMEKPDEFNQAVFDFLKRPP